MKTKQLLSKVLYSVMLGAALSFAAPSVQAQVKIGSNPTTIDPNNNLEVEGEPTKKFSVNKNGQVTIADGTQGAGRVFTSDANGGGSWQPTRLVQAAVNYTNDGIIAIPPTLPGNFIKGNISVTFPENGVYAVSFSFIGDNENKTPFPDADSWVGVLLASPGVPYLNHTDNLIPSSTFAFVSGIRYVTITSAPLTLDVYYFNSSAVPFTLRGNSTKNYNDWFAYKVF